MKFELIKSEYKGSEIQFNADGWFNATKAAASYDKKPAGWLRLETAKEYLAAMAEVFNCAESALLKTKAGRHQSGTWFHPRLAIAFARWLDPKFSIWCDKQIDDIVRGHHPHHDWKKLRSEATASLKLMTDITKLTRELEGKSTKTHHYTNEVRLVNYAVTGEFKKLDRENLDATELDLLGKLEARNAVLIARGMEYKERKVALEAFVSDWRSKPNQLTNAKPKLALVQ